MAIRSIEQLKKWFQKGLFPLEQHFHDWLDSFRHRSEPVPMSEVDGLTDALNNKFDRSEGEATMQVADDAMAMAEETAGIVHGLEEDVNTLAGIVEELEGGGGGTGSGTPPYIELVGLEWDTQNLQGFLNLGTASLTARSIGKRLPMLDDFTALISLPCVWDNIRKGLWFADDANDLKNPGKSLFFPAAGYSDSYSEATGVYWSSDVYPGSHGTENYILTFEGDSFNFISIPKETPLTVRCVRDINQN